MEIKRFTDLITWKKAHQLTLKIYQTTLNFPKQELFCLTQQMRRCASSISANIAEGFGRHTLQDKIRFYSISRGSNYELENFVILSKDLNYLDEDVADNLIEMTVEISKLINGLIKGVERLK